MKATRLFSALLAAVAASATLPAAAADAAFSIGVPGAPRIRATTNAGANAWLSANTAFPAMAIVTPGTNTAISAKAVTGAERVRLAANEAGFPVERTKPEYYLGDRIEPPDNVDWNATYDKFVADGTTGLLFDTNDRAVYVTQGGTRTISWVLTTGKTNLMSYVTSAACTGRPRRIFWTDYPYNAPSIDLSGKFVRFFGSDEILKPVYGDYETSAGGIPQTITNRIVRGLVLDPTTKMLSAYGEMQGQVVMAYYDTGTYERMLHVQVVEVCKPTVNVMQGEIGRALKPDGRGFDTTGLRARPTVVSPTDGRGEYLYQHQGQYSYSPKNGYVYPLRPTKDCRWNAEIYWMETDEMEVEWPFELDHYECDWPADATVYVRGDAHGDAGRNIFIPTKYASTLMDYQDPESHAIAPLTDGTFRTTGEGYSLLRLKADDNIWFVPIHSIMRSNSDYFTLAPEEISVGHELRLRGGAVAGTAIGFSPECNPNSPGYIYAATSDKVWNPNIYKAPAANSSGSNVTNMTADATSASSDTNEYASVVYAVTANNNPQIEVWWNTTIQEEGMTEPLEIPTLPQVYSIRWPKAGESPQIVIASQKGSGGESIFSHNDALYLSSRDSYAKLANKQYFGEEGGTAMFWMMAEEEPYSGNGSLLSLAGDGVSLVVDWREGTSPTGTNLVLSANGSAIATVPMAAPGWHHVAFTVTNNATFLYVDGAKVATAGGIQSLLAATLEGRIGATDTLGARSGINIGELVFWSHPLSDEEVAAEQYKTHNGTEDGLSGCYAFYDGIDLNVTSTDTRTFTEKSLGIAYTAYDCLRESNGPPALGTGVLDADADKMPKVYVQNDPSAPGYNPNEEHAIVEAGGGGYVAWAIRSDLNTAETSRPGVLVEYVKDGVKAMQWYDVAVTNSVYPELAADCYAGKALPGPHPLDFFDDPWKPETYWDESSAISPAHRDRKGQLWAKAAGDLHVRMYYPMQEGFAFPSLATNEWPAVGTSLPWLSLLDESEPRVNVLTADPAAWHWRVSWPEEIAEMEIGRTLTVAASGLPEVWNAKSVGILWPATDEARDATAVLFDPTVAQTSGFAKTTYDTVAAAVADLGIKQGAGGNGTLRKGKWTFDGLPPSLSGRFYLDTTADVTQCLKLVGEQEDNAGGVSLLHVNVLNDEERGVLRSLLDSTASESGKTAWRAAIDALATSAVKPSPHRALSATEDAIDYAPRDHYALFTMGATNYVTFIENDATNEMMNVAAGDPIQMHVIKVVPKYYVGRVVTREDPLNLLSQQLSVIYAEAFAGSPEDYIFEWRKRTPNLDGSVPTDYESGYEPKFAPTNGLTRFVIGGQGDTLANMVNTYYAMRFKAADGSPAHAVMGDAWSAWTDPPALAEGWVQRVLNNVTPFAQRMRDLVENEAETPVTMIRQAGGPYEGDVALNQDNLTSVGLIQLYETILNKAESMSLQLGIDDANANKQLQLAVTRLADLYNLLGDEAYVDALNPTIGFGANFNTVEKTGFELDYGALSSTLFAFDNQVPTLLDEELALLRGRNGGDGGNAPSTHLSPYYNRLVWNFTRGITAGEVAYAVNYDISGNRKGVIDYSQAAEMYPQGHGDAYGHYLSALSGYYRLIRNPCFSWGPPAMGEMVVADSVVNVDYYDEAQFAKSAYNVAKVALEATDRTARKAYRDEGGATGAGYIDSDRNRNFGYGEWASRGGFGALCNWAVGNALLEEEPRANRYYRFAFTGDGGDIYADIAKDEAPKFDMGGTWTLEFQFVADGAQPDDEAVLAAFGDEDHAFLFALEQDNTLVFSAADMRGTTTDYTIMQFYYTNAVANVDENLLYGKTLDATNGTRILQCVFYGDGNAPASFPEGYDVEAQFADGATPVPPEWDGWTCSNPKDEGGAYVHYTSGVTYTSYEMNDENTTDEEIAQVESGANILVALRSSGGKPVVSLFNAAGALIASKEVTIGGDISVEWAWLGLDYVGELGELRLWEGVRRSDAQLVAKREFVNPISDGLAVYLRTITRTGGDTQLDDEVAKNFAWTVTGGSWLEEKESGMSISFTDEGLKRIDRGTVAELSSLADIVPQIQRKIDQMDAGLNPLGLASGAIPFDITPIGEGDEAKTHFEQIRERAGTALANARKLLEKAQESGGRMRLLYESQLAQEEMLSTAELEFKNRLIEYFGYPYEGDIGPAGSYPQGYDGPDLLHYAWMEPYQFGLNADEDVKSVTTNIYVRDMASFRDGLAVLLPNFDKTQDFMTLSYEKSATGIILKPSNIAGKRRACGQIQDKLGELLVAYRHFKGALGIWEHSNSVFEYQVGRVRRDAVFHTVEQALSAAKTAYETFASVEEAALKIGINSVEAIMKMKTETQDLILDASPEIVGAGLTVNTDPSAMVAAAVGPAKIASSLSLEGTVLAAKNALVATDAVAVGFDIAEEILGITTSYIDTYDGYYDQVTDAAVDVLSAAKECRNAYVELLSAECAVETVVAEAERVIDERTLKRQQSVDLLTKTRYNEMFFRQVRNEALSRYSTSFDLAQKYAYLAAQAYDYETGLLSADKASGEKFMARIVGTRTLGEFDADGEPIVASDVVKGDGGLAAILAELDANWLVLKPRLGINNPQQYATWFSLRHDLFRIHGEEDGDKAWKTKLRSFVVDDMNDIAEFRHYCQPLSGSTHEKEPGLVIPFQSVIAHGYNFFGQESVGGDSALDSTYYATHIASAGVHFEGYDDTFLVKTPTAYLVPVGEDRMRAVGDPDTVLSWKVVDQTIPAPYAIGSTQIDDPDWTPLFDGATGGNDVGARIRRHPSFRAYYDDVGKEPDDDELDCTRLVGRSAWNTKWLLIIPAGALGSNRDEALSAFVNGVDSDRDGKFDFGGVSDIKIGLKTYSTSGN